MDKKRWQIEPFSKIQKASLKVVDVIVTHAKVVKAHAGTVLNSLIHYLLLFSWFGLDLTNPVALLCMSFFIQSARLA